MSLTEFVIRLISKLLLIASVIVLIIGASSVENDMALAMRMFIVGSCMAVPDLVIAAVEWIYAEKE